MKTMAQKDTLPAFIRKHLGCFLLVCALLSAWCEPAHAVTAPIIDEVSVFGDGSYPNTGAVIVSQTVNGSPATIFQIQGNYVTNGINIMGNPGTVTTTVSMDEWDSVNSVNINHATVTITADVNTGAVSVTVGGVSMTANPASVTIDGVTTSVPNPGGFSMTGTATVDDRIIQVCVNAGQRVCVNIFMRSNAPPTTPILPAAFEAQVRAAIRQNFVRAMRLFTDQLTNVMVMQTMMIGPLLDAKHQLESQQIFGEWRAEGHRDYQPSEQVCAFGTLSRAMVNAEERVRKNIVSIDSILLKRELLNGYSSSSWGPFGDMAARLQRYRDVFCDANDNKRELGTMCNSGTSTRKNNDLNYYRTVGRKLTLPINFTDITLTDEEEDVLTLSRNLFDHNVLTPIPERVMMPSGIKFDPLQDARMLSAVRGVARYSFAAQVAQKTPGTGFEASRLSDVLAGIGVAPADAVAMIGTDPSYYAQMNVLSKKLFQDPQFFTNLYIGPANVARTGVAMQALQIMHDRQRFEASLRKEMLLSMILEMNLRRAQESVANKVARSKQ